MRTVESVDQPFLPSDAGRHLAELVVHAALHPLHARFESVQPRLDLGEAGIHLPASEDERGTQRSLAPGRRDVHAIQGYRRRE